MTDKQITLNASQYCDTMNDKNENIRLIRFASYVVGATTTKNIIEKENTELKRDKEDLIFIRNQNAKCMCEDKENLAKAKEIIKTLLSSKTDFDERRVALWAWKEEVNKAEQFLNGEGCPDCFCKDCTKEDCGIKKLGLVEVEK